MKSEQEGAEQLAAVVYHIDKNTQEWEMLDRGMLEIRRNFDQEGVIIGHSIVVTKSNQDKQSNNDLSSSDLIIKSDLLLQKDYSRQQGTIISWNENYLNEEIAVSFSDKKTCDRVW